VNGQVENCQEGHERRYCYKKTCVYCVANFVGDKTVKNDATAYEFARREVLKMAENTYINIIKDGKPVKQFCANQDVDAKQYAECIGAELQTNCVRNEALLSAQKQVTQ